MLESKDIDILKGIMEAALFKSETSILNKVDERLEKSETSMLNKVDERLEKSETSILNKVDERLEKSETKLLDKMDKKLLKSEGLILDELERTRTILEKQVQRVQKNLDDLNQYYRITKLENDNTSLLLKLIEELSKRVEELEKRTA